MPRMALCVLLAMLAMVCGDVNMGLGVCFPSLRVMVIDKGCQRLIKVKVVYLSNVT